MGLPAHSILKKFCAFSRHCDLWTMPGMFLGWGVTLSLRSPYLSDWLNQSSFQLFPITCCKTLPNPRCWLQGDNTVKELRNSLTGKMACLLTQARFFTSVAHHHLVVGHTHEDVGWGCIIVCALCELGMLCDLDILRYVIFIYIYSISTRLYAHLDSSPLFCPAQMELWHWWQVPWPVSGILRLLAMWSGLIATSYFVRWICKVYTLRTEHDFFNPVQDSGKAIDTCLFKVQHGISLWADRHSSQVALSNWASNLNIKTTHIAWLGCPIVLGAKLASADAGSGYIEERISGSACSEQAAQCWGGWRRRWSWWQWPDGVQSATILHFHESGRGG